MLVLSRREHEQIKLGDAIVVTVVRIAGDRVRLGIEAPQSVSIVRAELPPSPAVEIVPILPVAAPA
jgi:carbon storage regulator